MVSPTVDIILTVLLILGLGIYFAWGVIHEAKRTTPEPKWLVRREVMFLGNILIAVMMLLGLLQAWRFSTWKPVWVLAGIAFVMQVGLKLWARK